MYKIDQISQFCIGCIRITLCGQPLGLEPLPCKAFLEVHEGDGTGKTWVRERALSGWFNLLNKQKDFTYTTYYSLPTPTSLTDLTRSTDILPTTKKSVYLVVNCTSVMIIHSMSKNLTVRQSFDRSRVYTVQGEMPKDLVQTEKHKVFFSFMWTLSAAAF